MEWVTLRGMLLLGLELIGVIIFNVWLVGHNERVCNKIRADAWGGGDED